MFQFCKELSRKQNRRKITIWFSVSVVYLVCDQMYSCFSCSVCLSWEREFPFPGVLGVHDRIAHTDSHQHLDQQQHTIWSLTFDLVTVWFLRPHKHTHYRPYLNVMCVRVNKDIRLFKPLSTYCLHIECVCFEFIQFEAIFISSSNISFHPRHNIFWVWPTIEFYRL